MEFENDSTSLEVEGKPDVTSRDHIGAHGDGAYERIGYGEIFITTCVVYVKLYKRSLLWPLHPLSSRLFRSSVIHSSLYPAAHHARALHLLAKYAKRHRHRTRNANLGTKHLLAHVQPMWYMGCKRPWCRCLGVH